MITEAKINKILIKFPDEISFVYFVVDSIKESVYGWDDEMFDFCKEESERAFWFDNVSVYPYLFTVAILRYYGISYSEPQSWCEKVYKKFHKRINEEGTDFSSKYPPKGKETVNIIDFLYSEPIFNLQNSYFERITVKKECVIGNKYDTEYGVGYKYVTYKRGKFIEELDYKKESENDARLNSDLATNFTSRLCLQQVGNFFDVDDVLSFAKTKTGFVYIVVKEGKHFLRGQGFHQLSRLIRVGKQPIYVKSYGNRVIVLMSDGTVTSNFYFEAEHALKAWFNNDGKVEVERENQ